MNLNRMQRVVGVFVAAMLMLAAVPTVRGQADPYQQLPKLDYGAGEDVLAAIQKECVEAKKDQYPAVEKKLLAALAASDATLASKQFVCRMLRIVGTPASIPALGGLLGDEKMSHMARQALYGLKDPAADAVLRDALAKTNGNLRIGIINTLGDRRDGAAVAPIAKLIGSDDATTNYAFRSLGKIGTKEAMAVLDSARSTPTTQAALLEARVFCGYSLLGDGNAADARAVFAGLFVEKSNPPLLRGAGLRGLVEVDGDQAIALVISAFAAEERPLNQAAANAVISLKSKQAGATLAKELPNLPIPARVTLINALVARGDRDGMADVLGAQTKSGNEPLTYAAIAAMKSLGDASNVPVLVELVAGKIYAAEASTSLKGLWADGVTAALIKAAGAGEPAVRAAVIEILGDRRDIDALPLVTTAAADPDKGIRTASIKALGALGGAKEIAAMLVLINKSTDNGEQDALAAAIGNATKRNEDLDGRAAPVIAALASASPKVQVKLIDVLKSVGGAKALDAVRAQLKSADADVKKAALRAMGDWIDDAPLADLKGLAKSGADDAEKIMALRGFIRMIGLPKNRKASEAIAMYKEAIGLATRPQEKVQALGGLGNLKDLNALKTLAGYFSDDKVKTEAMSSAIKVAENIANNKNAHKDIKPILQQIIDTAPQKGLSDKAKGAMEKMK